MQQVKCEGDSRLVVRQDHVLGALLLKGTGADVGRAYTVRHAGGIEGIGKYV